MVFRRAANNDIAVIRSPATDNDISVIWRHRGYMQIYIAYSKMKLDDGSQWWCDVMAGGNAVLLYDQHCSMRTVGVNQKWQ